MPIPTTFMSPTNERFIPFGDLPGFGDSRFNDPRFSLDTSFRSGFEEIARIMQFRRRDRALPLLEILLGRQGKINQLADTKNPFIGQIDDSFASAIKQAQGLRGGLDDLPDLLRSSALASTQGAQVAALQAARTGSGRGGLAFGGGSNEVAQRAAREAAIGQSSALANALVQGRSAAAQFNLGQAGLEAQLAQGLSAARERQAGFTEAGINRQIGARTSLQQLLASFAGVLSPRPQQKRSFAQDIGSIGQGIGSLGTLIAACWVAREVIPERWTEVRDYIVVKAPKVVRQFYMRHGQDIAEQVKRDPELKESLRPKFEKMADLSKAA